MFSDPLKLMRLLDKCPTISFTASCPDLQEQSLERRIFDRLGLDVAEYWPSKLAKPTESRLLKVLDVRSAEELADSHRLSIVCVKACELCAVFIAGSVCVCVIQSSGLET